MEHRTGTMSRPNSFLKSGRTFSRLQSSMLVSPSDTSSTRTLSALFTRRMSETVWFLCLSATSAIFRNMAH